MRDSEDEPSAKPAEEKAPANPTDNELFDIDEASPSENTDTEIIPLDDGGGNTPVKSGNQEDEGTLTLPDDNEKSADITDIPETPETPENPDNLDNPDSPDNPESLDNPDTPEDTPTSDDTIYFDDTPQPTQGTTQQKATENTYDLEDEYYELDGF